MIIFPPTIQQDAKNRPLVIFKNVTNRAKNDEHIAFPIPQSIQFSDSAAYGNSELGFAGSMVLAAGRSSGPGDALNDVASKMNSSAPKDLKAFAGLIGSKTMKGEIRSAIGIATGTTLNKNITTEFTGVSTRQFSFQFKLITNSQAESDLVKKITDTFRLGLYPRGNALQLQYPPSWYINFKQNGTDIKYLPKIFETYLTTMSTAYNSSMNLFHPDGSPVETDIQLTFMESRALTVEDIESLIEREFEEGDLTRAGSALPARNRFVDGESDAVASIPNNIA